MGITIYTNPNCVQCDQTKRAFNSAGVAYETVDLSTNPDAVQMVLSKGHKIAPVVITDHDEWSGFRLDRIKDTIMSKDE